MIPVARPVIGEAEQKAVRAILESGMLADGGEVRAFETEFAEFCSVDHAIATMNGTAALHAALEGLGIGPGDRVVTTPFSFVASSNAIRLAGATPVFADIDPETYNLDPVETERVLRETNADAILAVHLYGLPADMAALADIAWDEDVLLVEDAAQALGARLHGRAIGQFGDAAAFSFYPTKTITTGEGGMVVTDREPVAKRVASYVNHGRTQDGSYEHERLGHNYRMTSLGAAIGRVQLNRVPRWIDQRRRNAEPLTAAFQEVPDVSPPVEPAGHYHAYNQYTVRSGRREALQERLAENGIGSAVYYPNPISNLAAYAEFDASVPVAREASEEVLSLPVFPGLDGDDIERIVGAVHRALVQER